LDGRGEDIWRDPILRSTPTLQSKLTFNLDDYEKKGGITIGVSGAAFRRVPLERLVSMPSVIVLNLYFARSNVIMLRVIPLSAQFGITRHGVRT